VLQVQSLFESRPFSEGIASFTLFHDGGAREPVSDALHGCDPLDHWKTMEVLEGRAMSDYFMFISFWMDCPRSSILVQ
jgi:hypothetical protein